MIQIRIISNLRINESIFKNRFKEANTKFANIVTKEAIKFSRQESPVRTGKFKQSIEKVSGSNKNNSGKFEAKIKVGSRVKTSKFIIGGTKRSVGKFVPSIGRRIETGTHPGIQANPVFVRAKKRLDTKVVSLIRTYYNPRVFRFKEMVKGK